jgi:hypothetical protein
MKLHCQGWARLQSTGPTTSKALPGNPTITSAEETDVAISVYTSTTRSAKNASKLYHTYLLRDLAIPDSNYSKEKENKEEQANLKRGADRRQYEVLKIYIYNAA